MLFVIGESKRRLIYVPQIAFLYEPPGSHRNKEGDSQKEGIL